MKSKTILLWCGLVLLILSAVIIKPSPVHAQPEDSTVFDPSIVLTAMLPSGSLGLPGDPITWVITVSNTGVGSGTNVVISDTVQSELRIDHAQIQQGEAAISDQMVVFTIPVLNPGETVSMQINTTVLYSPNKGVVLNQAMLAASSPEGPITRSAVAELYLPATLPATGYPPAEDMPGDGEPSAFQIGLAALGAVLVAAAAVWYRGRRPATFA
jgi:uncharacterized repeat protein (TIGR01451 family)